MRRLMDVIDDDAKIAEHALAKLALSGSVRADGVNMRMREELIGEDDGAPRRRRGVQDIDLPNLGDGDGASAISLGKTSGGRFIPIGGENLELFTEKHAMRVEDGLRLDAAS